MDTGGTAAGWPSKDATVLPYGKREMPAGLCFAGAMLVAAAGAGWATASTGSAGGRWPLMALTWFFAIVAVAAFGGFVSERHNRYVIDATGWWWFCDGAIALVPWESLAAAGVHYAVAPQQVEAAPEKGGAGGTLELFPRGEFDRHHPVLWKTVREDDPPVPGLPRWRYRIALTGHLLGRTEEACRRWAPPGLWFGSVPRPEDYEGAPDRAAHRRWFREGGEGPLPVSAVTGLPVGTPVLPADASPADAVPPSDAVPQPGGTPERARR